jgi:hypothetical protein
VARRSGLIRATAILFALSLLSPEFLPVTVTTDDKASLLLLAIVAALGGGFVEELAVDQHVNARRCGGTLSRPRRVSVRADIFL